MSKDEHEIWDDSETNTNPIFTPATSVSGRYGGTWNAADAVYTPAVSHFRDGDNDTPAGDEERKEYGIYGTIMSMLLWFLLLWLLSYVLPWVTKTSELPIVAPEPSELPVCAPCPSVVSSPRVMKDNAWDDTIPWPGNTYMIIEKATGHPITIKNNEIFLAPQEERGGREATPTPDNTWFCAENQNYFGFLNKASGRYLGHNGHEAIHAEAFGFRGWETFTARPHPSGGYHLLTPFWAEALQVLAIAGDGHHLIRRTHGGVLWEFRKV